MNEAVCYPVFLRLDGRPVLVVGGGPVAASKLEGLLRAGARVTLVAPEIVPAIDSLAAPDAPDGARARLTPVPVSTERGGSLTLKRRRFELTDLDDVWFIVAAATPEVNRAVSAAAEARHLFVNAVDDPPNASVYLGGVLRRDGVTLAISTDGQAPALAGLIREGLDALLPHDLDRWTAAAQRARLEWKAEGVPMEARRPKLLQALVDLYAERGTVTALTDSSTSAAPGLVTPQALAASARIGGATSVPDTARDTANGPTSGASAARGAAVIVAATRPDDPDPPRLSDIDAALVAASEAALASEPAAAHTPGPTARRPALPHCGGDRPTVAETRIDAPHGFVSLVGAGPGDPELLTLRAQRRLEAADLVLYDALVSPDVLPLATRAQKLSVGKRACRPAISQDTINRVLVKAARRGRRVVRLKCGDPFVFGRGGEEAMALAAAGVPFEIVPGVSSALAAPALAGVPVTHRGVASSFMVVSGHSESTYGPVLDRLSAGTTTLVVLMGIGTRAALAARLIARGWAARTPAAVLLSASTPDARTWTGTLEALATHADGLDVQPGEVPGTLVIGEVVALASQIGQVQQWLTSDVSDTFEVAHGSGG